MPKLKLPDEFDEKSERALNQLEKYAAACFWCGHGYEEYSPELEDEHFANHCPDAPEELRESARKRLMEGNAAVQNVCSEKKATSKRRCRGKR
jgi:hypothetical protein